MRKCLAVHRYLLFLQFYRSAYASAFHFGLLLDPARRLASANVELRKPTDWFSAAQKMTVVLESLFHVACFFLFLPRCVLKKIREYFHTEFDLIVLVVEYFMHAKTLLKK